MKVQNFQNQVVLQTSVRNVEQCCLNFVAYGLYVAEPSYLNNGRVFHTSLFCLILNRANSITLQLLSSLSVKVATFLSWLFLIPRTTVDCAFNLFAAVANMVPQANKKGGLCG